MDFGSLNSWMGLDRRLQLPVMCLLQNLLQYSQNKAASFPQSEGLRETPNSAQMEMAVCLYRSVGNTPHAFCCTLVSRRPQLNQNHMWSKVEQVICEYSFTNFRNTKGKILSSLSICNCLHLYVFILVMYKTCF